MIYRRKLKNNFFVELNLSLLIFLLWFPFGSINPAAGTKVLKPNNFDKKVTVIISGKEKSYYSLSSKHSSIINAKGPGRLKIITRPAFTSDKIISLNYSVYYRINGQEKINENFRNVKKSSDAKFKNAVDGFAGNAGEIIINLERGVHTIEIWSTGTKTAVYARYLFTSVKEKKIDWVPLSPLRPNEPVNLVTNENVVTYYRFNEDKPLKVRINGPTVLRILSRVENHYYMKGRINYRLQVSEDGKLKNTYLLNSIRSDVTTYKKKCGSVPGKAKEIIINVPEGKHIYKIIPLDKDKSSVLARILFPKKDVILK